MRYYEIMLLTHPDYGDQVPSMLKRYTQLVESTDGVIHRLEDLGRRPLAYPINKLNKAYYILFNIECTPKTQQELKDNAAFNDAVIRCLSIRQDKPVTEPSVLHSDSSKKAPPASEKRQHHTLAAVEEIDYKNADFLSHYLTETSKIARRRVTGGNAKQQHQLSDAVKLARFVGLLPHCDKYDQPVINW